MTGVTVGYFIFDMDGTLLDSIKIWHESEERILQGAHVELSKDERDQVNALTLEEAATFFHERFGIGKDPNAVIHAIIDHMLDFYTNEVEANPGAISFVRAVYEAGATLCVLSSSPQAFLQAGLGHVGLKRYFPDELIISAEDIGLVKRDPATFTYLLDLLGSDAADTWLFDDSWYALKTAHDVGLRTVGVYSADDCGTHEELARFCEVVVDDFTELAVEQFV